MRVSLLVLLVGLLPALRQADIRAIVKSEFIADQMPTPQCHASTIVETPGGLLCAWFGGKFERHPEVGIWLARHDNGHWLAPVEVANGVQADGRRYPTWNPVLFQPRRGPLMLFYKVGPDPASWWGMLLTSSDGGKTWSGPRRLPDRVLGPVKNKPLQLANGDILCASSTEAGGWSIHFERTSDLGATWHTTRPAGSTPAIQAIQPALLQREDGRIQAIGRSQQDRVFSVVSTDGGQSWGAMALLDLPNPNSGLDAVTLSDGRSVIVYNHARSTKGRWDAGRDVLNVAVSNDGKAWSAALLLEDERGQEFSYPAVIQSADGLVHITYTWKRQRIRHVVLDPSRLTLRPIVNGEWPK
jgi:predicted neuraminidase